MTSQALRHTHTDMAENRKPPETDAAAREIKLAEALRANLRRRKTADRAARLVTKPSDD